MLYKLKKQTKRSFKDEMRDASVIVFLCLGINIIKAIFLIFHV